MSIKKLLILTSALLVLANEISAQVPKRYEVIGPISSLREETARLTQIGNETIESPRVVVSTVTYDEYGNTTERVVNHPDGTLHWKVIWIGRSMHDSHGRETERVSCNASDEVTSRTVFIYDSSGNQTKVITYNASQEITSYSTFEYDGKGQKIRADHFNADGSTRASDVFTYDSHGYPSEVTHSEGILQHRDSYKYDDRGNETEWAVFDKDGKRIIKVALEYRDDSRGNPTKFLRYDSNDKVRSREVYSYEFDSRGNWIKSKTTREVFGGPASIIDTEITYRTITYREPQ
jgi:hypothetical protein